MAKYNYDCMLEVVSGQGYREFDGQRGEVL
jgi:hypothetical protein